MNSKKEIDEFLSQSTIAVSGVSRNKNKFGNAVFKELKSKNYKVYPVNPNLSEFEGEKCYTSVSSLPQVPGGLVISVNKDKSLSVIEDAVSAGVKRVWFQKGAESDEAVKLCRENNISVIFNECILMFAQPQGFHKFHRWVAGVFGKLPA